VIRRTLAAELGQAVKKTTIATKNFMNRMSTAL
jgi:hypothetical protein